MKFTLKSFLKEKFGFKSTDIPRFTLLMWGLKKNSELKNYINQGYLAVLKERKID